MINKIGIHGMVFIWSFEILKANQFHIFAEE
jgi:hypothetical protein